LTNQIWTNVLTDLEQKVNPQSFRTWLKNTELISLQGDILQIKVTDDIAVRHINGKYLKDIEDILVSTTGKKYSCNFITEIEFKNIKTSNMGSNMDNLNNMDNSNSKIENNNSTLNPKYTFENFVVGPNNQLAHAAAKAVSKSPADQYNPLFIYGDTGLGKTHLIQAIGHHILQERPYLKVLYIPTEQFINEFIYSIQTNTQQSFKIKYRNVDILIVDDIQFLEKKEETQNEFFFTFESLYENRKQIIISSDRPPKQIATLTDRLKSRFSRGGLTDIQTPNLETREAILRNKAAKEDIIISEEAYNYIARRITSNIRVLESALATLRMVYDLYNEPINIKHVKEHLKHLFDEESNRKVTLYDILNKVSELYNISVEEIISKSRQSKIVMPRFAAMYLTRKLTDMTVSDIGKEFGDRDHSTVINAINKVEQEIINDPDFKELINELITELKS
jgi:chromosomal replication initiator protein